jgi:hypothetical protein
MPETLTCPECQRKVRLPDHLIGKRVKCPSCGGTFTATPATVPAPAFVPVPQPPPFEPEPPPPRYQDEEPDEQQVPPEPEVDIPAADVSSWFGVRMGLKVQVVAHGALAGGLFLLLLLLLIALGASDSSSRGRGEGPSTFMIRLSVLMVLALLAGWIFVSVAGCFLLGTTTRRSARGLVIGALLMGILILLQLAEALRSLVPGFDRGSREESAAINAVFFFFFEVTRLTLVALMLRAMCLNLGLRKLGASAQLLALLTPSIMLGTVALLVLIRLASTPGPTLMVILQVLVLLGWIGVLAFGLIVMLGLKTKLDYKLPRTEPD